MKRLVFLILVAGTAYFASMYHSMPLLVLCAVEVLMLLLLGLLPFYLRHGMTASFPFDSVTTEERADAPCRVTVRNRGRLPVSRFTLRLRMQYPQDRRAVRRKIAGGIGRGEQVFPFRLHAPYCGLVTVRLDRLRAYDYLALFSASRRLKEELRLAVFPADRALRFEPAASDWNEGVPVMEQTVNLAAESSPEIRRVREYQDGDPTRRIHWSLSARTDRLWVKEFQRETDSMAHVLLDTTGFSRLSAAKAGAFYKLLSALTLGLLSRAAVVRVHWYENDRFVSADVTDTEQCREMLLRVYQLRLRRRRRRRSCGSKARCWTTRSSG